MAAKTLYWATRPFGYVGLELDRGQIFEMAGARNDEKLVRLGYVQQYTGKANDLVECAACGGRFIGHNERIYHYEKRHVAHNPFTEDEMAEREECRLEEIAPLNLDQTAATLAA